MSVARGPDLAKYAVLQRVLRPPNKGGEVHQTEMAVAMQTLPTLQHFLTLSTVNPTWTGPGLNPVLHGERPAIKSVTHGVVLLGVLSVFGSMRQGRINIRAATRCVAC